MTANWLKSRESWQKNNGLYNLLREIVKDDKRGTLVHLSQHAALFMSYTSILL